MLCPFPAAPQRRMPTHERDSSSAFCSQEGEVEVESLIEFLVKCKRNVRVLHSSYRPAQRVFPRFAKVYETATQIRGQDVKKKAGEEKQ